MKKNLLEILKRCISGYDFTIKYDKTLTHTILYVNGVFAGYYDVMEKDINSYCALDSLKEFIGMVEDTIMRYV